MTEADRYLQGDSVVDIAEGEDKTITDVLSSLRMIGVITTSGLTVTERLDQPIEDFLDAYYKAEIKISALRLEFSLDNGRQRLGPAYVYRILDELQIERRRKNNRLPRFKRQLYALAVEEYRSGRTLADILTDTNLVLNEESLIDELSTQGLIKEVSEEVL